MWKLGILLTWLVHAQVSSSGDPQNLPLMTELDAEFDKIAEDFLSSLTIAHTRTPSRKKRDLSSDIATVIDDSGVYRLKSIDPVSKLCQTAVYSKFVVVENDTYAICADAETSNAPAEVVVGLYKDHQWRPEFRWFVANPNNLVAFHFKGLLYVLVAEEGKDGTNLVRINLATKEMVVDHTVHSRYSARISTWTMKVDGKYHMAIANFAGQKGSTDFSSEVYFYEWFGTYFDKYSAVQAYDVKDLEPFHIHGAAYLAIANFRKSKTDYNVDSEIVKYDLDKKKWISHQKIRTHGARDWEFFSIGSGIRKEFFLVVANSQINGLTDIKSTVFKFVKDKFIPFQCLPTERATAIASWSKDLVFLLAVANMDAVYLYQYDGWQFVLSNVQYTKGAMSAGVRHLVFQSVANDSGKNFMLSVSNPYAWQDPSLFEFGFYYENYLRYWNEESTNWCLYTLNKLESTDTGSVMSLLDDVVFVDQTTPITINGSLYFENGFGTDKLKTPLLKEIITQETYDGRMLFNLEDLQRRLQEVSAKIDSFEQVLNHALQIEGNQTVYGNLEFQDVSFDCETQSCHFDSIQTTVLNGEIGDWGQHLVFLDSDQVINGTIFAEKLIANEINVQGLIDGVDSRTLVTKSGDHTITGTKTFVNLVEAKDIEVHGLVDGVKISPDNVLLTTGHQKITGNLIFSDVETTWLEVGFVNGINLTLFYEDVVRSDQPGTIVGTKTFHDIIVDELFMNSGATINGVDIADLWANALRKDGNQEIKAPITFQSMSIHKNLEVVEGINGIEIPGPRVVNIYDDLTNVYAPHAFSSSIKIAQLNVMKSLNGLAANEVPGRLPELDILLKTGDQVVTGKKTFHTIHLDADSAVRGTVDGVDLSEFKNIALRRDSSASSNRTWTFNNLVIKGPLSVNTISGYNINDIYDRALKLTDEQLPNIRFRNLVKIDELESHDINGLDIEKDVVLKNKPQTLTGRKTFNRIILEDNVIVLGTVNNLNMSFLQETILRIGNQALKSKVFNGNVKMNKLTITGSINNVPITELVTLSGDEALLNTRELINVTFNEIEANNLEVAGTVNGINVDEMMEDTMTYDGNEVVKGMKTVKGTIHIVDGEHVTAHNINGVNINEVWDDAVFLDTPQEISGIKTFRTPVSFDNLVSKDTIDGISEWDMNNWMLKDTPQVVSGNVIFSNGLAVKHLDVEGYINGINLVDLDKSIVKVNEPNVIEGPVIFYNTLVSTGDIGLTGKIQDVDLSEEAVTKSGEKVVTGVKTFARDLVIQGDATVGGLVDGISIQDLCEKTLLIHKQQNITHMTIKGDVTFLGGGTIEGKIADVDLMKLHEIAVSTEDSELTFSGEKTFRNLTIEGPVIIEGSLGGVDLNLLNQTYLSLTRDQEITARMDFEDLSFEGTLAAKRFNTTSKIVNGIDVGILNRILRIDTPQTVTADHYFDEVIFASDVFVAGKVNGLDVPGGLMRHNHVNYVQSPKLFEKPVAVLGDLVMAERKRIQGVDVSEWYKKSVLKDGGEFEIDGHKTFYNPSITDASVAGYLDGLKISEESLLMAYGDQVITGRKTVKGDVDIKATLHVDGFINGVDLNHLSAQTLQKDRSSAITGIKEFREPLTIYNLQAPTVAGIDVVELEKKVNTHVDFGKLQSRLNEIGEVISNMQEAVNKQAVVFQYYEMFQEFDIPAAYSWQYVSGNDCGELLLLSDNSSSYAHCSSVRLFKYDEEQRKFVAHPQELPASYAVSVKSLFIHDITYLFVANQNPNIEPICLSGKNVGDGNTTGDIYIWNGNMFERYQTLEVPPILNMVVFQHGSLSCIVYVEQNFCEVYCSKGRGLEFELLERLPTRRGIKASIIQTSEITILAIVAQDLVPRVNNVGDKKPVDIYVWHPEMTFGQPIQVILSTYAQSVLLMHYTNEHSSYTFLVVAEGRIPRVQNEPKIVIYRYEESVNQFYKYQEIRDYGEVEWIVLKTGELILFALDSYAGKINLYQHKGASGFVLVDTVNSIGSIAVHAFIRQDIHDGLNHYLALAGPRAAMIPSQGIDYAKILKSKVKGNRHFINV